SATASATVGELGVEHSSTTGTSNRHADLVWLGRRLELFRRFFVPSVGRLEVPVVLLCSTPSSPTVAEAVADLDWISVVNQDDWHGGWTGEPSQVVTRMDSDDAIHEKWIEAVDAAPLDAEVCCTREFLRFDSSTGRLCAYRRRVPSPLAAFRNGCNPFAYDHAALDSNYRVHDIDGPYLLQVYHGGNVSSRRPSWYRRRHALIVIVRGSRG
ncbi:MAG: hypothetical protein P8127_17575, partial [Acidobacteriota bacterium]